MCKSGKCIVSAITTLLTLLLLFIQLYFLTAAFALKPDCSLESGSQPESQRQRVVYLTFDDGPSRNITPAILDILQQEGVAATFYVLLMKNVDDIYLRIINEGHQLGNHTSTHDYDLLYQSDLEDFIKEVRKNHEFIVNNFGYEIKTFRFPGSGSLASPNGWIRSRREFLHNEMGYRDHGWHISGDAGVNHIFNALKRLEPIKDHIIILFHDSSGSRPTPDIIIDVIIGLKERGYAFDVMHNYPLSSAEEARIIAKKYEAKNKAKQQSYLEVLITESLGN